MNPNVASTKTKFRVGLFAVLGLLLIGAITVYVNDRPYWWRPCDLVHINVEDATGLKEKSAIRSLGLEIGFLSSVQLSETHVRLGICITAPVEVLPTTRAYIRGEGFLGDKFVELKPVRYLGSADLGDPDAPTPAATEGRSSSAGHRRLPRAIDVGKVSGLKSFWSAWIPSAQAADEIPVVRDSPKSVAQAQPSGNSGQATTTAAGDRPAGRGKNIPVGRSNQDVDNLVKQVDGLVGEMTALTNNLKEAINPQELRKTMLQLNKTLENASRTLSPEGSLTTTAQRTLAKLEDAIEQMRDQMARVNRGEGSVGKLLNDPSYAEEIRQAIRSVNSLLTKVAGVRFVADLGAVSINAYDGSRGYFNLAIYPSPDRYYLLGVAIDPLGVEKNLTTTTTAGGLTTVVQTKQVEQRGIVLTGMLGKILWNRVDLSAGILYGLGTGSMGLYVGPPGQEERYRLIADVGPRSTGNNNIDLRATAYIKPSSQGSVLGNLYVKGGLESIRKFNNRTVWFVGAGISFDDQDIKLLFALR